MRKAVRTAARRDGRPAAIPEARSGGAPEPLEATGASSGAVLEGSARMTAQRERLAASLGSVPGASRRGGVLLSSVVQRHAGGEDPTMVYPGKAGDGSAPHFDEQDAAFRAWIAAFVAAAKDESWRDPDSGRLQQLMELWCRERRDKDQHFHAEQVAAVRAWLLERVEGWGRDFWGDVPKEGRSVREVAERLGRMCPPEDRGLVDALVRFDYGDVHPDRVRVRPATLKALHVKQPAQSLHPSEQNWAPTGTFTGGGAKGFGGEMKPYNVMVSRALTTPREVLQALLFESENVKRWSRMEGLRLAEEAGSRGRASERAQIEYEAFAANQATLLRAYGVADHRALCLALGVPGALLVPVPEGQPVPTPDYATLRDPTARNALWWFQTSTWSDGVRRAVWTGAEHGGGMASSKELYGATKGGAM